MTLTTRDYARQAMIIVLAQRGRSVQVEYVSADPIEDCEGPHYLVRWHDRSDHAVIRGQARFYPEGEAAGLFSLHSLSHQGMVSQTLPAEKQVFRGTDAQGLPCYIGPEELVRYAINCLDIVLDMSNVIPPLDRPSISPDGEGGYRIGYEAETLTVEALFRGGVREGRLTLQKIHTPHWNRDPNSVDVFGGYDEVTPGKPRHLRSESEPPPSATVQAI